MKSDHTIITGMYWQSATEKGSPAYGISVQIAESLFHNMPCRLEAKHTPALYFIGAFDTRVLVLVV